MVNCECSRMKADASIFITSWRSIFQVSLDRKIQATELGANLVVSSCFQFDFQQTVSVKVANTFKVKTSLFTIRHFVFVGFGFVLLGISCHPMLQGTLVFGKLFIYQSPIGFLGSTRLKLLIQSAQSLGSFCKN